MAASLGEVSPSPVSQLTFVTFLGGVRETSTSSSAFFPNGVALSGTRRVCPAMRGHRPPPAAPHPPHTASRYAACWDRGVASRRARAVATPRERIARQFHCRHTLTGPDPPTPLSEARRNGKHTLSWRCRPALRARAHRLKHASCLGATAVLTMAKRMVQRLAQCDPTISRAHRPGDHVILCRPIAHRAAAKPPLRFAALAAFPFGYRRQQTVMHDGPTGPGLLLLPDGPRCPRRSPAHLPHTPNPHDARGRRFRCRPRALPLPLALSDL